MASASSVAVLTPATSSSAASSTASTLPNSTRMRSTLLPYSEISITPVARAIR